MPAGQTVDACEQMLLVEVVGGGVSVKDAVASQWAVLDKRKSSDPLLNMGVLQHDTTGEVLLDFIVSSKDAGGEYIVEWNAYRYAPYRSPREGGACCGLPSAIAPMAIRTPRPSSVASSN